MVEITDVASELTPTIQMTYDEYDAMVERFERVKAGGKVPVYWPTIQQIDEFEKDPEKWLRFCCYLHEMNPEPSNNTEKYSRRNLGDFINRHLVLVDND